MKLKKCNLKNFASYKELDFDFENLGLSLVQGATGSGKSTLLDSACWVLFGITAKDGSVDDIRSWNNLEEKTIGTLTLETYDRELKVVRVRGKSHENDLYWVEEDGSIHRGKDITETQQFLNKKLGCDSDLFLSASYHCEFSPSNTFFVAKSKAQRELFENIADLKLAIEIAENSSEEKKKTKKVLSSVDLSITKLLATLNQMKNTLVTIDNEIEKWNDKQGKIIQDVRLKSEAFEDLKKEKVKELLDKYNDYKNKTSLELAEIESQITFNESQASSINTDSCQLCKKAYGEIEKKVLYDRISYLCKQHKKISSIINPYYEPLNIATTSENYHEEQLKKEIAKENPFLSQKQSALSEIPSIEKELKEEQKHADELRHKIQSLSQLYDLSFELRAQLLLRAIETIQNSTNSLLESYFNSELRVQFSMEDSDHFEVSIHKNGYPCVYRQLSKGQRGLLKLCFSVSVMESVSNKSGINFGTLFFDEALDGLDSELKVMAFTLFQDLEAKHNSVIVIDHSLELKSMFNRQYLVTLIGDNSQIELINE